MGSFSKVEHFTNIVILQVDDDLQVFDTSEFNKDLEQVFKMERAEIYIIEFLQKSVPQRSINQIQKMRANHKNLKTNYYVVSPTIPDADAETLSEMLLIINTRESKQLHELLRLRAEVSEIQKMRLGMQKKIVEMIKKFLDEEIEFPIKEDLLQQKIQQVYWKKHNLERIHSIYKNEVAKFLEVEKNNKKDLSIEAVNKIKQKIVERFVKDGVTF